MNYTKFCIDEYPNQPEIPNWPMSDVERVELATLESLADNGIVKPSQSTYAQNYQETEHNTKNPLSLYFALFLAFIILCAVIKIIF